MNIQNIEELDQFVVDTVRQINHAKSAVLCKSWKFDYLNNNIKLRVFRVTVLFVLLCMSSTPDLTTVVTERL